MQEDAVPELGNAPAPEVVSIRIREAQNEQNVEAPAGRPFAVELSGELSQGYAWTVIETPAFMSPASDGTARLAQPDAPDDQAPVLGLGGAQAFFFTATTQGSGDLVFDNRRFGGAPPAHETFRVKIIAQ